MKRYFITATGTDIGKTFITAALTWQVRSKGLKVKAIKPIISGFDAHNPNHSDSAVLLAAQDLPACEHDTICPWRFAAPLSPDMAAKAENRHVSFENIVQFCERQRDADYLFIEGAGGVMTPVTDQHTILDLIQTLNIPAILVTGNYVGTLSHTLTALRVLTPHMIIVNESAGSLASLEQTADALRNHTGNAIPIRLMQRLDNRPEMWKHAPDLTEGFL